MDTLDRETLLERLRGIEWDDFEVKRAAGGVPKDAYTTVSAFANTAGGWIVFGVKEVKRRFEIVGVDDPDGMQNDFLGGCRSTEKFSRPVEVRPHHFVIDGHTVLAFYVAPSRRFDKPIRVRVDKAWYAYIRVAARDHKCTAEEEARFLRDASSETFDVQSLPEATLEDLDAASLRWVRALYRERHPDRPLAELSDTDFLDELGLMRSGQLTHAAALLFGRPKLTARLKPGGLVDFRLIRQPWSEEAPAHRFDDRVLCEGNIIEGLRTLIGRFLDLVPNPFALDPSTLQREAHPPEYPALRESLVNLLIHQDYSDPHRTARVLWYSDRTLFDNPGDSFVSLPEMLDGGASDLRNPRLARLMRQIGFAEQAGTGLPTIVRIWRQVERTSPAVVNDPGRKTYQLILSWERVPKREDAFWKTQLGASVSPDEARILDWLRRVGPTDRASARMATGASARETRKMVEHLLDNSLIETVDDSSRYVRIAPHIIEILDASAGPHPSEPADEQATPPVTQPVTQPVDLPVVALLRLLAERSPLGAQAIREGLTLKDRAHVRETYINPALTARLIEMTIPDKPHSSQQKYRLTDAGRTLLASLPGDDA
ncbi:MAG: putative DNA binding domain-containing protein [Lamprobacter sp.]|uniref:Fic family protein n=1 Tax=Lamprobacter sp. TaxID=3100796 RepID=UPI002B25B262|nr:RNA-binding domain-containing protein [Lamprobacter sp.]MEA3641735.1 putative DNA binding domain-containing protein [Lamprobacter sp.]